MNKLDIGVSSNQNLPQIDQNSSLELRGRGRAVGFSGHKIKQLKTGKNEGKELAVGTVVSQHIHGQESSNRIINGTQLQSSKQDARLATPPFTGLILPPIPKSIKPPINKNDYIANKSDNFNNKYTMVVGVKDVMANKVNQKGQSIIMKSGEEYKISKGTTATSPELIFKKVANKWEFYGILKPGEEGEVGLKRKLEKWGKTTYVGEECLGLRRPTTLLPTGNALAKAFGEATAFQYSKWGWGEGKGTTPPTHFVKDGGKLATFQESAGQGFTELSKDLDKDQLAEKVGKKDAIEYASNCTTPEGLTSYLKCTIETYRNGGIDCHLGNIMCKRDENNLFTGFKTIDQGNILFSKFPSEKDTLINKNYCGWAEHPLSKVPFTDDCIKEAKSGKLLNEEENIKFLLAQKEACRGQITDPRPGHNGDDFADSYFEDPMIINTILRIKVLKEIINTPGATPKDLAAIKSEKQTFKYLEKQLGKTETEIRTDIQNMLNEAKDLGVK